MREKWVPILESTADIPRHSADGTQSVLVDRILANSKPFTLLIYACIVFAPLRYVSVAAWTRHYRDVHEVAQRGVAEMNAGRLLEALPHMSAAVRAEQAFNPLVWFAKRVLRQGDEELSHRLRLVSCADQCPLIVGMQQLNFENSVDEETLEIAFGDSDRKLLLLRRQQIFVSDLCPSGTISEFKALTSLPLLVNSMAVDQSDSSRLSVLSHTPDTVKLVRYRLSDETLLGEVEIPAAPRRGVSLECRR